MNSGFMIAQVTAAALASENKSLAHPASVDSLPTSANQEDHVSMATFAARRLTPMAANTARIVAIELLAAAQGVDLRRPLSTSPPLAAAMALVRADVPFWDRDRAFAPDLEAIRKRVERGDFVAFAPISQRRTPCIATTPINSPAPRRGTRHADRVIRAPRGTERTAKSWLTEAALRMIQNNLDPEVAENPKELVVYGGIGRAARNWECFDAIVAALRELERRRVAADPVGQAGRRVQDARRRAARAHRQFEPRAEVGDVGALQRARPQGAHDVRPDDGRLVDLHRQPGHRAGHLRDLRRGGPPALRRAAR